MTANLALPKATRKALRLTWLGLWAERITRAFWPVWSVVFVAVGAALLGVHEVLSETTIAVVGFGFFLCILAAILCGARQLERPKWVVAQTRLDKTLSGRPISSLLDAQAIGTSDPASQAVWEIHQNRMRAQARLPKPLSRTLGSRGLTRLVCGSLPFWCCRLGYCSAHLCS